MIVYGLDPGITGAVCALQNGERFLVDDIPTREEGGGKVKRRVDAAGLAALLRHWRGDLLVPDAELVVIERVSAMPGQGVSSVFSLGHSAGACEAVFLALGIRICFVSPASWKKALGVTREKATSAARASLLYPSFAGHWQRVKDHNRAEALLLAHWGWVTQC